MNGNFIQIEVSSTTAISTHVNTKQTYHRKKKKIFGIEKKDEK